jgi:hypothetical protein
VSAVVSDTLFMRLETGTPTGAPVLARLRYEASDPYAVTVAFCQDGTVPAEWRFDREMLAEGLRRPLGEGRVRFRPRWSGHRHELCITLLGSEDEDAGQRAVITAWAPPLMAFLNRTFAAVPGGEERTDLDSFLARVLAEG